MKHRLRFGLSLFLTAVAVLGSGIGMSVRYYRSLPHHYTQQTRLVDGYKVTGSWQVDRGGTDKLVWLLVFADGNRSVSGNGNGNTPAAYVDQFEVPRTDSTLGLWSRGLFQNGKMFDRSDKGDLWLYMTTRKTVAVFELPKEYSTSVSLEEFKTLEETRLWKEQLLPAAERESAEFKKHYFEQHFKNLGKQKNNNDGKGNVPPITFSNSGS